MKTIPRRSSAKKGHPRVPWKNKKKPARPPRKRGKYRSKKGIGATLTTSKGGTFTTRSTYETRYVWLLEHNPMVAKFTYEPYKIKYKYRKRMRNYTPDFLVEYRDGSKVLIEVKPERMLRFAKNKAKIRAATAQETPFRVVTETELFT
jgi:hypothetical protein